MDDNEFEVEAATPLLPAEQQASDTPLLELHPQEAQPPSPRRRFIQVGLVVVAFVVALVIVVPLAARQAPDSVLAPHQPTVPPLTVLLRANINFGTVTINGKRQRGTLPMLFKVRSLAQGDSVYQVVVDAPPFYPVTCTISFIKGQSIAGGSSNCDISASSLPEMTANGLTAAPNFVVDLSFTDGDLPTNEQDQVSTLLHQSLAFQQSMTVPAGSYIATGYYPQAITSERAAQPLQATAFLNASTDLSLLPFPCNGLVCQGGITLAPLPTRSKVWLIESPVALRWQFTAAGGRVVGDISFPAADLTPTMLVYDERTGWSLAPSSLSEPYVNPPDPGEVDCQTGSRVLFQLLQAGGVGESSTESQKLTGCKITLQDLAGANRGVFIWRFGVLLAADETAHQALPSVPIAPQAEIDAVPA